VEGGELSVLQGAQKLLESGPRPVILAEVQDIRTKPWGYPASEIIQYLSSKGYKWFSLTTDGAVAPLDVRAETFDGNFVACPEESERLLNQ
jgi:Methyltransferase FkbM domain